MSSAAVLIGALRVNKNLDLPLVFFPPALSARAAIQFPRLDNDWLMAAPSFNLSPVAPVLSALSLVIKKRSMVNAHSRLATKNAFTRAVHIQDSPPDSNLPITKRIFVIKLLSLTHTMPMPMPLSRGYNSPLYFCKGKLKQEGHKGLNCSPE